MYYISYHHTLGDSSMKCQQREVAGILRSIMLLALSGHRFSNLTITKVS